ncbi:MAG: DUF308 domain-containing protein [Sulfurimonas sp.]|nr:DUF308 domain-containing protein [Sulfurimonas sp.]
MWEIPSQDSLFDRFRKYTKITGIIFIILGIVGIIYPTFMTIVTVSFISWLMLFAGTIAAYFTYISNKSDVMGWLKSFLLIIVAFYMLLYPLSGAGTLGLLLSIYFFVDAFSSFSIGLSNKGHKSMFLWFINGFFSAGLGVLFVLGWPLSSMYLIGLFVGISLLFDGIALLVGGSLFDKMLK